MATQIGNESALGDYHIYDYSKRLSFGSNEHVSVRLYESRKVKYSKTYVFQNGEKRQKEEPLEIEFQIKYKQLQILILLFLLLLLVKSRLLA